MDSPRTVAATRSEYVQARLDAILSRAQPEEQSPTVLTARRRHPAPVREESSGSPRRTHGLLSERSAAVHAALAVSAVPAPTRPSGSATIHPETEDGQQTEDGQLAQHEEQAESWPEVEAGVAAGAGGRNLVGPGGVGDERSVTIRLPQLTRRHLGVLAVLLALAVAFSTFLLLRARADSQPVLLSAEVPASAPATPPVASTPAAAPPSGGAPGSASPAVPTQIWVHVLGAVTEPGVVRLPEGSRVVDALERAGGLTSAAEPGQLNLAQVLADGQQVHVAEDADGSEVRDGTSGTAGAGGEGAGDDGAGGSGAEGGAEPGQPLDLNAATLAQLDELPGVGPVTAGKILSWREEHGRFSRVEELQEVSGIGPKTYAEIAPHVRV